MTTAVFPGTFDPITLGHADLVARASRMFDKVIVGVAAGHHKKTMFTLDERVALVRESTRSLGNVDVQVFDALLVEFAMQHRAHVVVRGVRNGSDFNYEFQMAGMNRERMGSIETVFLMPSVKHQFVSSSFVREIATLGGEVGAFVSAPVLAKVQARVAENAANAVKPAKA